MKRIFIVTLSEINGKEIDCLISETELLNMIKIFWVRRFDRMLGANLIAFYRRANKDADKKLDEVGIMIANFKHTKYYRFFEYD